MAINKDMEKRIIQMASITWNSIGYDILQALEDLGESPIIPREEVMEVVSDADHMKMYGGDEEAYDFFKSLSTRQKSEVLKKAFVHERYGW